MNMSDGYDVSQPDTGGGFGSGILSHLPAIFWERRWLVIVPLLLGILGSAIAYFVIPPAYQSTAVLLVESPQLARDVTGGLGTEIIDRRIERIRQQITSRPDLVSLIEKLSLYNSERNRKSMSTVLDDMRKAIKIVPSVGNLSNNQSDDRTIAFKLTFEYKEPAPAQAVTQELMERILELDASSNSEQATNTVQFLTDQAKGLETQIAEIQGQITSINAQNGNLLAGSGITMVGGNSGSYEVQIAALQRDNANLASQRDIVKTSDNRDPAVSGAEAQLAALRSVYAETHPDVVIAKQRLAEAQKLAKNNIQKLPMQSIDQQIAFNNSQIAALRTAKTNEQTQMIASMNAQARGPAIRQQIEDLNQRLSGLNAQYETVSTRLFAAKAGARADDQQMGEKLSVVDPPVIPDKPSWPDRWALLGIGVGGGLLLGLALALATELLLSPIRDPGRLSAILGVPPLGIVPVIEPATEERSTRRWFKFWRRKSA